MTVRNAFVVVMLAVALVLSASAFASTETVSPSVPATYTTPVLPTPTPDTAGMRSTGGKRPKKLDYDLTWTLPTAGKSGCTVCHDDKDLVRIKAGKTVSLYVSTELLQDSAHKNVPCTGCHLDFAYEMPPHTKTGQEWRTTAKLACKRCHRAVSLEYTTGAHSPSGQPGESSGTVGAPDSSVPGIPKPLCGDCHGGHGIPAKSDVEAKRAQHASGMEMCGRCHVEDAASYDDYYHGSAYKREAPDAPACWDCHSPHKILPSTDRESTVNKDRLTDTCRKCHSDPRDGFVGYAELVHGKQGVLDSNPVQSAIDAASGKFKSLLRR